MMGAKIGALNSRLSCNQTNSIAAMYVTYNNNINYKLILIKNLFDCRRHNSIPLCIFEDYNFCLYNKYSIKPYHKRDNLNKHF